MPANVSQHGNEATSKQPAPQLQLATGQTAVQPISTPPARPPGRKQPSRSRNTQAALEEEVEQKLQQLQLLEHRNQQLRTHCRVLEVLVQCGTEISRHLKEQGCSDERGMTRQHSLYCKELELLLDGMAADNQPAPRQQRPLFEGANVAAVKAASVDELRSQWLSLVKEAALDLQHQGNPDMQQRLEEHAHALLQLALVAFLWNPAAAWHIAGSNLLTGEPASIPPGHAEHVILSTHWEPDEVSSIIAINALQTHHQAQLEQETAQLSTRMAAATAARDRVNEEEVALQLRALMARKTAVMAMHVAAVGRVVPLATYAHVCVQSVPYAPLALSLPVTMERLVIAGQL